MPRSQSNPTARNPKARLHTLGRITRMAFRHRIRMTITIAFAVAAGAFQLWIPRLLGSAVDSSFEMFQRGATMAESQSVLVVSAAMLFGASVAHGLFTMLHNYHAEAVGQFIGYELRLAVYEKVQRLSFSYHDAMHSGDLITRGMLDVEGVRLFVNTGIIRLIVLTVLVGAGSWLMISTEPVLGLVALSFVPVVGWRAIVMRLRLRKSWHGLQRRLSVLTRIMEENLGGIRVVRSFGSQDYEMSKFDRTSARAFNLTRHRIGVRVRNATFMSFIYFISMGLVLTVGGSMVLDGSITIGRLTEFLAYLTILQMPVRQMGLLINSIARATTSGERLFDVLDREPDIQDKPGAPALKLKRGVLTFDSVGFAYEGQDKKEHTLKDISFEVKPGQTLGLVGPPGAGKSTIAHLIPRFYDVTSGSIRIDGQDVRDVTLESLRRAVSVIQQDSFIFTARLENNLAYGNPWVDRDRIEWASETAQLHSYIDQLPKGYRTLVGERGVSLSGGQKQRLAIARMLVLQSPIMVFDDSTAAIDAATEQRIRQGLASIAHKHATIVIAHRLSSLMHADEILFIDDGRIVERGTHESLLGDGGRYAALYALQTNPDEDEQLDAKVFSRDGGLNG